MANIGTEEEYEIVLPEHEPIELPVGPAKPIEAPAEEPVPAETPVEPEPVPVHAPKEVT